MRPPGGAHVGNSIGHSRAVVPRESTHLRPRYIQKPPQLWSFFAADADFKENYHIVPLGDTLFHHDVASGGTWSSSRDLNHLKTAVQRGVSVAQ